MDGPQTTQPAYLIIGHIDPDEYDGDAIDPDFYVARCPSPPTGRVCLNVDAPLAILSGGGKVPSRYGDGAVYNHLDGSLSFTTEEALGAAQEKHGRPGQQVLYMWEVLRDALEEAEAPAGSE